jgi:hypothetical protein
MSGRAGNQFQNLSRFGVAPERLFREYELPVHGHLEHPAGGGHQPDVGVGKDVPQLSRQTGGSVLVISDNAVFDDHAHRGLHRGSARPSES